MRVDVTSRHPDLIEKAAKAGMSISFLALTFSYLIVFSGRFLSSFLFRGLKEVDGGGRSNGVLKILFKPRQPGSPSGGPISPR